jgi:RNA recognition motif-containing protein
MDQERTVFVGGLHPLVNETQLEQHLSHIGSMDHLVIRRDDADRSRCFGYVTFAKSDFPSEAVIEFDGIL